MRTDRITKLRDIVFVVLCAAVLGAMALSFVLRKQEAVSEAQELALFPAFSLSGYVQGTFQEQFEQAAKDQFVLHDQAVAMNAGWKAGCSRLYSTAARLLRGEPADGGLVPYGDVYRMYGTPWLTNLPFIQEEELLEGCRKKAGQINAFAASHPEAKVYVYYCSRAEDMDWFDETDGISSFSYYEYLRSLLEPQIRADRLKFRDFEEYRTLMYRTDHHWNNNGAALGYADLLRMLSEDFPELGGARSVLRTKDYDRLEWTGSRARECGVKIPQEDRDIFRVDQYILEEHQTFFGDREQTIGLAAEYDAGEVNRQIGFDQYLNYYGFESSTIRLEYEGPERKLLLVGDSFTRALREPLASHFGTTVFVNYRILGKVDLEELMAQYGFDAVIFMGQQDAWCGYYLDGEE